MQAVTPTANCRLLKKLHWWTRNGNAYGYSGPVETLRMESVGLEMPIGEIHRE